MAAKFFLVLCASALLVQSIAACSKCGCGRPDAVVNALANAGAIANANLAASNFGFGYPSAPFVTGPVFSGPIVPAPACASASGGPFSVTLTSPYAPTGISVDSVNTIEGVLEVVGSLPVFAAVNVDGNVASSGAAGTSYSCGNGNVGISSESLAAAGFGAGGAIANDVVRAEIAGAQAAQLANAAGYGAGLYGAAGLNAAITQAELASIRPRPCGCGY